MNKSIGFYSVRYAVIYVVIILVLFAVTTALDTFAPDLSDAIFSGSNSWMGILTAIFARSWAGTADG